MTDHSSNIIENAQENEIYRPDLSQKNPNDFQKVKILETTVQRGTPEDLKAVLAAYQPFEMMSRALGLAARYRGLDFVKELMKNGAVFRYTYNDVLQRKYSMNRVSKVSDYRTEYYLMLVPEKLETKAKKGVYPYDDTPMHGIPYMEIPDWLEDKALPLQERLEIAKYIAKQESSVSLDEMLFWALTRNEVDFADGLIAMGVDLQKNPPSYYTHKNEFYKDLDNNVPTYMETIVSGKSSLYWTIYTEALIRLDKKSLLPVLKRFHALAAAAGKKLVLTQKGFDGIKWNNESLCFALENIDLSRIDTKKMLEFAVLQGYTAVLSKAADTGWLSQPEKLEALIQFAGKKKCSNALAWLLDFQDKTVDRVAEIAKKEKKMRRELAESPNSVSAMGKFWGYKKLEDGTYQITSYKGNETEVSVPAYLGKTAVTSIGENTFSIYGTNRIPKNRPVRENISSIIIPSGVTNIGNRAFGWCNRLTSITIPDSVTSIQRWAFDGCSKLNIHAPAGSYAEQYAKENNIPFVAE